MGERVIERTYKYTLPTPKEVFESFRDAFSNTALPESWQASPPWTMTVLGLFNQIGRNLGYLPRKEWLRLDQTWEIRHSDISVIVLALEHENTPDVEELLDDELQKLLDIKAFLKVLVFYPMIPMFMEEGEFIFPNVQEKIRSAKIKNPDERYVIMGIVYVSREGIIEVSATCFDSEGKGEELGSFQVKYSSKD